jgi:hypothetical protein
MVAATEYKRRGVLGLGCPRMGRPIKLASQHLGRLWTSTCFEDSRWLRTNFGMIPMPLEAIWNYTSNHIYRTSKPNSVCDLGIRFIAHCSWIPNWLELELLLAHPCWTSSTPFHAPIMVVCMGIMSSSLCAMNSRIQINKCKNYLPDEGEHRGPWEDARPAGLGRSA